MKFKSINRIKPVNGKFNQLISLVLFVSTSISMMVGCSPKEADVSEADIYKNFKKDPVASRLQDFSYAGYRYGEQEIPEIEEKIINVSDLGIEPNTSADLTDRVQQILDSVGQNGGGVILFPRGKYLFNMDTSEVRFLKLDYSNVVLRGEGSGENGTIFHNGSHTVQEEVAPWISPFFIRTGYTLQGTTKMWGLERLNPTEVKMKSGSKADPGLEGKIFVEPVIASFKNEAKKGSSIIDITDSVELKAGDVLLIGMYNSNDDSDLTKELFYPLDAFEDYMKSALLSGPERAASYQFIAEIKKIHSPTKIELMQPMRIDMPMKYSPVIARAPMLSEIGIEHIRFETGWDGAFCHHGCSDSSPKEAKIMDYGWNGVDFVRVSHGWMRNLVFTDFTNPIYLQDSRNVTIQDVRVEGYNGHSGIKLYGHSEDNLIQNIDFQAHFCHLVGGEGNGYGNVFRNVTFNYQGEEEAAFDFHGFSERTFAPMGWNLFENFKGVTAVKGAGASFNLPNASRGNTFWNIEANQFGELKEVIQNYKYLGKKKLQTRNDHYRSYPGSIIVGYYSKNDTLTIEGSTDDRDDDWLYIESLNEGKVLPKSLYEAQFALRTGIEK